MNEYAKHWTTGSDLGLPQSTATVESHVSPEIYAAEVDRIYRRVWLMIGRVEEIPGPADFMLREVPTLTAELIVVRGKDDVVRAFHNTCAHRGVPVVHQKKGTSATFRCPYHSWLYGADGKLRSIPAEENFPCVDKANSGLVPVNLDIWNGFIFVNFADEPEQSLAQFLGGLGELHETLPFDRYQFHVTSDYDVAGNWKACMHTFSEGYHITSAHSRTLTPQIINPGNPTFNFYDVQVFGPHSTLTSERNFDWLPKSPVQTWAISQMAPAVMPSKGDSPERDFATHPSINRIQIPNFGVETITIFPNICLQPLGGGYLWMTFWPLEAGRTLAEIRNYSGAVPTNLREEFTAGWAAAAARDVLSEDFALTAQQQRGFEMGARTHQQFGENEGLLRFFAAAVDHYLHNDGPFEGERLPNQADAGMTQGRVRDEV